MSAWLSWLALAVLILADQRRTRRAIQHEARKTMSALKDIADEVAKVRSVELSAITLINGLKARLDEAIENEDTDALQALSADLAASSTALAAAVAQNTPADQFSGAGPKSFDGSSATANTSSPAPEDLPDGHPFKPVTEESTAAATTKPQE